MRKKAISPGKFLLIFFGVFLISFFWRAGVVKAETCTWTASSSAVMSLSANWDNGAGASCTISADDVLIFSEDKTTSGASWDAGLPAVASVSTTPG